MRHAQFVICRGWHHERNIRGINGLPYERFYIEIVSPGAQWGGRRQLARNGARAPNKPAQTPDEALYSGNVLEFRTEAEAQAWIAAWLNANGAPIARDSRGVPLE